MANEATTRRDLPADLRPPTPGSAAVAGPRRAAAQTPAAGREGGDRRAHGRRSGSSVLSGYLDELNGRTSSRSPELVLEPGGYVGEHHHAGPGIRQVTSGSADLR